ncbi:MAG: NifB/NifX family molybdenum-iron cluster-binding protein [Bacteroidota bacterium]
MNILFSSKGKSWDAELDPKFGRATGFLLYNKDEDKLSFYSNEKNQNLDHGAGIQAGQQAANLKASVVITGHVGPKAKSTLQAAGIEIFTVEEGHTIKEAYEMYLQGKGKN